MITLYRSENCAQCTRAEAALRDMVIAHRVVSLGKGSQANDLPPGTPLPAIRDGNRLISGEALSAYLEELDRVMADWGRFQSDSCYIDGDGNVC